MRGLTIVLGEPSPPRLATALTLLLATQALGGRVRLFLEGAGVALLAGPLEGDAAALWEEALAAGVGIVLCQTGLAGAGLEAAALDPRLGYGGPLSVLQSLGEDRLVIG